MTELYAAGVDRYCEEWLQASIAAYVGDLLKMQALLSRIIEPLK